mgnify:CR=1 FL=1
MDDKVLQSLTDLQTFAKSGLEALTTVGAMVADFEKNNDITDSNSLAEIEKAKADLKKALEKIQNIKV